jgi:hypothetical protein
MKFRHHGANQPVQDITTGKVESRCQNQLHAVDAKTLPKNGATHINLNDRGEGCGPEAAVVQRAYRERAGTLDSSPSSSRFREMVLARVLAERGPATHAAQDPSAAGTGSGGLRPWPSCTPALLSHRGAVSPSAN